MRFLSFIPLWLATGTALGVGFVVPSLWFACIAGVVLFITGILQSTGWGRVVRFGFLTWFIKSLAAISWYWSVYPIDWLPVRLGAIEPLVIAVGWLLSASFLAVGGVVVAGGLYAFGVRWYTLVPVWWLMGEVVGSLVFAIGTYGPGGTFAPVFSFGYVGYLLAQHNSLILLAQWGGVYVLSVLLVGLGLVGYKLSTHAVGYRGVAAVAALLVLIAATGSIATPTATPRAHVLVAVVDTTYPSTLGRSNSATLVRHQTITAALRAVSAQQPDFILLPEDARYSVGRTPAQVAKQLGALGIASSTLIDNVSLRLPTGEQVVRGRLFTPGQAVVEVDKQFLVPHGEFLPVLSKWLLTGAGYGHVIAAMETQIVYEAGPLRSQQVLPAAAPSILFCFESVTPLGVKRLVRERAVPFVAHPISHGWFNHPERFWHQLDTMLTVQSVWNNVAIVSAANQAHGTLYTPDGKATRVSYQSSGLYWQAAVVSVPLYR